MAIHLHCLTSDGGVPLFSKTSHTTKQLPFPIVASLNGIQIFSRNHGVDLVATDAGNYRTVWKIYNQCITLILLCDDLEADVDQLTSKLDLIYHALLLMCGKEDLSGLKNVERLKKHLKLASRLCEALLEEDNLPLFCDATSTVDLAVCPEQSQPVLQSCLDTFAGLASTSYACLLAHGRVVVATRKWFALTGTEQVLLSLLLYSMGRASSKEMLVYLPNLSPEVPHRFMSFQLVPGVEVCVLTGNKPSLAELYQDVARYWKPVFESLKTLTRMRARNLPSGLILDANLLGFIYINTESRRSISSVQPQESTSKLANDDIMTVGKRRALLRNFYRTTQSEFFNDQTKDSPEILGREYLPLCHRAKEVFVLEDEYKCFAMRTETVEFYALFSAEIPNHALRPVTEKTLVALTKDKSVIV